VTIPGHEKLLFTGAAIQLVCPDIDSGLTSDQCYTQNKTRKELSSLSHKAKIEKSGQKMLLVFS